MTSHLIAPCSFDNVRQPHIGSPTACAEIKAAPVILGGRVYAAWNLDESSQEVAQAIPVCIAMKIITGLVRTAPHMSDKMSRT